MQGEMQMGVYGSFTGAVMAIQDFWREASEPAGCVKHMTLADGSGNTVNFLVMPDTYFVDHGMVSLGDTVTGFYDTTVPVPMIYPPQYVAAVMAKMIPGRLVTVDYFGRDLVSSDGNLKLNIGPNTVVMLKNGQTFFRQTHWAGPDGCLRPNDAQHTRSDDAVSDHCDVPDGIAWIIESSRAVPDRSAVGNFNDCLINHSTFRLSQKNYCTKVLPVVLN
jgi:hypothetical protein